MKSLTDVEVQLHALPPGSGEAVALLTDKLPLTDSEAKTLISRIATYLDACRRRRTDEKTELRERLKRLG